MELAASEAHAQWGEVSAEAKARVRAEHARLEAARAALGELKLNPSQEQAVGAALTQRLTLVQGPPGTGKTRVACEMIKLWVRAMRLTPVLVVADSNVAVDNIGAILAADGMYAAPWLRPPDHPWQP